MRGGSSATTTSTATSSAPRGSRLNDLRDALPRITDRWARLNPAPTRDIPILIGGSGEKKTLRYTAEHASTWHSFSTPDQLRHRSDVLAGWCADVGRHPAEIERSVSVRAALDRVGADLLAAGATQFVISATGPDYDLSRIHEWVAWRDEQNA